MKPICVKCQRFYRPKHTGYRFIEGMPTENGAKPGTQEPEKWKPYKTWIGDLWECLGCGHQTIVGVGSHPTSEHYLPDFQQWLAGASLQVNDC